MVNNAKEQTEFRGATKQRPTAVCIIVENLPVPLDRRVWREAATLRDAGYSVSVISPKGKGSFTASHEVLEGIHIYRHAIWEPSSALGYLLEYALALVGEFYLSLKVFARTRFRILQGCNPPDTIFLIGLFFKLFGVRYVFDHHDLSPELFEVKFGRKQGLLRAVTRIAELCSFKVAEVAIACNESFREIAVTRGGKKPEQVFVVRNCPDLTTLGHRTLQPETRLRESFQVAYVGFMAKQDGLPLLVEAIEHLVKNQNRQDTHFLLVGGGSELAELRGMVAAKELNSYVTFTGQVSHEDVAAFLADSDVGVAPDPKNPLNDSSTMIKIFEYMAFGLPVVLFDLKEGRRVAGPAALYALPNDPVDFANQISRLLDSPELRRRLGECGRARIEEALNWETEKHGLLRAYRMALEPEHAS